MMAVTFGALLRSYRVREGLSQWKFAQLSTINVGTINRLEREQRMPSTRDQVLLLAALVCRSGTETDELLHAGGFPCARCARGLRRCRGAHFRWWRWRRG